MTNLSREVRLALRRLRAAPVFTVFAIVTLAINIGARERRPLREL